LRTRCDIETYDNDDPHTGEWCSTSRRLILASVVPRVLDTAAEMRNDAGPAIALGVGILFTLVGIVTLPDGIAFLRAAETADGIITEDLGHKRGWVQFTASDGDTYGFRAYVGERSVGDHIEVTYRGDAPWREGAVVGGLGPAHFPAAFGGGGLLALAVGTTMLLFQRRRTRARRD
jgi:hypothetical protein